MENYTEKQDYEYNESRRVAKSGFNIFKISAVENKPNYFIGSLFFGLPLILFGVAGAFLIALNIQIVVGGFMAALPLFGIAALCYGLRYLLNARKLYLTGKKYIAAIDAGLFEVNCVLCADGKIIVRTMAGVKTVFKNAVPVVYSKKFDTVIYLKPKENGGNATSFKAEDAAAARYLKKLEAKERRALNGLPDPKNAAKTKPAKIRATDAQTNSGLPGIVISSAVTLMLTSAILAVNTLFRAALPEPAVIAVTAGSAIMLIPALIILIRGIKLHAGIKSIIGGSALYLAKITSVNRKHITRGSGSDEWVDTVYSFTYQITLNGQVLERTSAPCYNQDQKNEIKKLPAFPVLYNKARNKALYFSAKHCRILTEEYYK